MKKKHHFFKGGSIVLASGLACMVWLYFAHLWGFITLPVFFVNSVRDIGIFFGGYFLASMFVHFTSNKAVTLLFDTEVEQRLLLTKIYTWFIYLLATSIVLVKLGVSFQNIALYISLLATGFAFAIRDILISYFAWFILLVKKPFHIGDCIKIGDEEGRVVHIGTFFVLLDENPSDGNFIKVPNKMFLEKPIKNFGHDIARFSVTVPVTNMPSKDELLALERSVKSFAGKSCSFVFNGDVEHLFVKVEYDCFYENRKDMRNRIVRAIAKKLMK